MKINKIMVVVIIFLAIQNIAYSQFPIGKNIKVAEKEIKQLHQSNGFTFLRLNNVNDKHEMLEFSEEFTVVLGKNYYENVPYINISTTKSTVMSQLKVAFNFSSWAYIGEFPNVVDAEIESIYEYKNYRIRIPYTTDVRLQFTINLKDEN